MKNEKNKYTIYLGLNDKDRRKQLHTFDEVTNLAMKLLDYATFQKGKRLYKKELENCIIITRISNDSEEEIIKAFCNTLKFAFNQESVLYTKESIEKVSFC